MLLLEGVTIIYSKFKNLKSEKQKKIIDASLKEFAHNGYDKASTNEIVESADISKGALFNYFHSKKELYIFLLDYGIEIIEKLYKAIDFKERDIFKRIGNIGIQKIKLQKEFPHVFDFLASSKLEESAEVKSIIGDKIDVVYDNGFVKMYKDIDYSMFREDIDIEKAIEILNWAMFGFGEKSIRQIDSFKTSAEIGEDMIKEWEQYSKILKETFYKKV